MSGVKHTPGPWEANFSFPGLNGIGDVWQIDADGHAVCTTQFCYAPNTEANARLIALSPEMFDYILSSAQNGCATAQQIIARARGEQSPNHSDQKEVGNG